MKRVVLLASLMTFAAAGVLVVAQQTTVVPQPRANALPGPGHRIAEGQPHGAEA